MQNVAAAIGGAALATFALRRRATPKTRVVVTGVAVLLLLATLIAEGVQGVHRSRSRS